MPAEIFRKILAADDGSPDGEKAADVAVRLGAKLKSEVILLGVVEPANIQAEGEGLPQFCHRVLWHAYTAKRKVCRLRQCPPVCDGGHLRRLHHLLVVQPANL